MNFKNIRCLIFHRKHIKGKIMIGLGFAYQSITCDKCDRNWVGKKRYNWQSKRKIKQLGKKPFI